LPLEFPDPKIFYWWNLDSLQNRLQKTRNIYLFPVLRSNAPSQPASQPNRTYKLTFFQKWAKKYIKEKSSKLFESRSIEINQNKCTLNLCPYVFTTIFFNPSLWSDQEFPCFERCFITVLSKLFEPRHTKISMKILRHSYQSHIIFFS
jgi:hypothetical protein